MWIPPRLESAGGIAANAPRAADEIAPLVHSEPCALTDTPGRHGEVSIEPITGDALAQPARRPAYSALDSGRYRLLTGETPRPWEETLRDYLSAARSVEAGGAL